MACAIRLVKLCTWQATLLLMLRSLVFRWGCSSEGEDGSGKLGEQEPSEGLGAGERARRVPRGLEQPREG